MKIGIDARCLQDKQKTGVAEYALGVFEYLFSAHPQDEFLLFFNSYHEIDFDLEWLKKYPNVSTKKFSFPNKLINIAFYFLNWPKVDKMLGGVDVFYMPNPSFVALSKYCRKIVTVHDLSFERFPETFSLKRRIWHFMVNPRKLCRQGDKIWAVSESTRQDLEVIYGINSQKISVSLPPFDFRCFLPEKLSSEKLEEVSVKYNLPSEFILFIGTVEPRKNITALIDAFAQLKREASIDTKDLKLVIAGGNGWLYNDVFEKIESNPFRNDIILTDFISDEDKPFIYRLSKIFVYPSIFEGFGYPPIEAMASGIPTVTSNCSSIPEVVEDGAILIDPYRPYEITIAMKKLLFDKNLYQYYSEKGRLQAKKISEKKRSWEI